MYSELECGICYQTYNAGRRCPRELQCKHSFCESCLMALCRPQGHEKNVEPDRSIVCPMCRHVTAISGDEKIRAALRVDEGVLERLVSEGVLDGHDTDDCEVNGSEMVAQIAETHDPSSSPRSTGGRLKRSWKRVWGKIIGKRNPSSYCMTADDLRALAMVSYLF